MLGRVVVPLVAAGLLCGLASCSSTGAPRTPSPAPSTCAAAARPSPSAAQPVDGGSAPPAPLRVTVRAVSSTQAEVRITAQDGEQYESSQLRVFVDGCPIPWTDEGDQLPVQTVTGLHRGDRVQVLARLNAEGGNSAETASAVVTMP